MAWEEAHVGEEPPPAADDVPSHQQDGKAVRLNTSA